MGEVNFALKAISMLTRMHFACKTLEVAKVSWTSYILIASIFFERQGIISQVYGFYVPKINLCKLQTRMFANPVGIVTNENPA